MFNLLQKPEEKSEAQLIKSIASNMGDPDFKHILIYDLECKSRLIDLYYEKISWVEEKTWEISSLDVEEMSKDEQFKMLLEAEDGDALQSVEPDDEEKRFVCADCGNISTCEHPLYHIWKKHFMPEFQSKLTLGRNA